MTSKTVFISADHGLAVFYFMQSQIIPILREAGVNVVVLTDDQSVDLLCERYSEPGLIIEGLRLDQVQRYTRTVSPSTQWWLDFFRRAGAAPGANLAVVEHYIRQVKGESHSRRRMLFPLMEGIARTMRTSPAARRMLQRTQMHYAPSIYGDLFEKYRPSLVIAASPGFRQDRYLLREAKKRNIKTVAAIITWDSSSSYGLPGAPVDYITCWSEIQKQELVGGADWDPKRVHVGGMPPYDGYITDEWLMTRQDYYRRHNLDPRRKLLSYASSFVSWSPNLQNVEALASLVTHDVLAEPTQLLVRLHPIHMSGHYVSEADAIRRLAAEHPHIHVVEPVPLGALGHYSGEDMAEKTSMMAYSDIFLTVYSTMCVEASFQERPIVSVCIDSKTGWPGKYWVPMSEIGVWPTHSRFRTSGAGKVALNVDELRQALNYYLRQPEASRDAQRRFLAQECTYTDGSASRRTAEYFLNLLGKAHVN
ncbi:MAG TPA: CDP-glycerol glycerophosphotransferase family protein [Anaerolineales bacterium]|nr:CDP-glycerol glycerophosphotransferase family protein [Anaerolineales bacterium]